MSKLVSDILYVGKALAPLSFLQIKVGKYEVVCPWCTKDLGQVKANTFGVLVEEMFPIQAQHMNTCSGRELTEVKVQIK